MHPALMIAVMEEHQRELARRTRHARRQPPARAHRRREAPSRRLYGALARGLAFFG